MPVTNGFTVGRDISLDLYTSRGPLPLPPTVTSFHAKPVYKTINSHVLGGQNLTAQLPSGWEFTIEIDRSDDSIDAYFAQAEADYYAGIAVPPGTITETITEADGSVSQYRYTKVSLKFDDAGNKQGDNKVTQSFSGSASQRIKVL